MERPRSVLTRTEKWCPGCEAMLAVEEFHADRTRPDGRMGVCKTCKAAKRKEKSDGEESEN